MEWDNCSSLHIFINSYAHLQLHTFAHYVFSLQEYLLSLFTVNGGQGPCLLQLLLILYSQ